MNPQDQRIVELLHGTDAAAREEGMQRLLRRHGGAVRFVLARHVVREHDLDDLLQEVWLKVYRARDRLTTTAAGLRPWLFRVARNTLVDQLRRRRPQESPVADAAARPDRAVEHRDELDALRREFARRRTALSAKQQHCVEDLLAGRFAPERLAGRHGCTRESVHMELLRGLRKLGWRRPLR
jgi:RNA polymerase sigma-70 factor (ECF subfamily)